MKDRTKNNLVIAIPVTLCIIASLIIFSFVGSEVDEDISVSYFELVNNDLGIAYQFGLDKNFSVDEIVIYDHNGTVLFRTNLNNETLLNTTLHLELTLREFIGIYDYSLGRYNKSIHNVFIQVAEQLKDKR